MRPSENLNPTFPSALVNFDQLPASAFVRLPVVRAVLGGRSAASIYRDVQAGRLPAPVALGPRCSGWNVGRLREAITGMTAACNKVGL